MKPLTQKLFNLSKNEIYRYSEKPFLLASGKESNHYFNCKKITLLPERLNLLCEAIAEELLPSAGLPVPESVGGLTMGADPISYGLSLYYFTKGRSVFPIIVRKQTKDHGTGRRVEGELEKISSVMVVDDVVTTAGSTLQAVRALREEGKKVEIAVCILDRQEGGEAALEKEGVRLVSVFRKSDFIQSPGA